MFFCLILKFIFFMDIFNARWDLFVDDLVNSTVRDDAREKVEIGKKGGGYRLKNGRYASKEAALEDEYAHKLSWLRYEREKYQRAWLAACDRLSSVERELRELKGKVRELAKTCQI